MILKHQFKKYWSHNSIDLQLKIKRSLKWQVTFFLIRSELVEQKSRLFSGYSQYLELVLILVTFKIKRLSLKLFNYEFWKETFIVHGAVKQKNWEHTINLKYVITQAASKKLRFCQKLLLLNISAWLKESL